MAACIPAQPSIVPADDCVCLRPSGCPPVRNFQAVRAMTFHVFRESPIVDPLSMPDPQFFLRFSHPEHGTFVKNRYTLSGTSILWENRDSNFDGIIDEDGRPYFSQRITPEEVMVDLDALFAEPWPDPDHPTMGIGHARNTGTLVQPIYDSAGNISLRAGDLGDLVGPAYGCAWAQNTIFMAAPAGGATSCSSGFIEAGRDVDQQSPYRLGGAIMIKSRGQFRSLAGGPHCLYDIRAGICSGPKLGDRLNCRQVEAEPGAIVDIPVPPLGFITIMDEFCDCQ